MDMAQQTLLSGQDHGRSGTKAHSLVLHLISNLTPSKPLPVRQSPELPGLLTLLISIPILLSQFLIHNRLFFPYLSCSDTYIPTPHHAHFIVPPFFTPTSLTTSTSTQFPLHLATHQSIASAQTPLIPVSQLYTSSSLTPRLLPSPYTHSITPPSLASAHPFPTLHPLTHTRPSIYTHPALSSSHLILPSLTHARMRTADSLSSNSHAQIPLPRPTEANIALRRHSGMSSHSDSLKLCTLGARDWG
jgi:hypothetical protein